MEQEPQIAISISRQIGSGGAYIGRQLAKHLDISYLDREIISEAAQKLSVLEEELEFRDEKLLSFWQTFFQLGRFSITELYLPPQIFVPSDEELFQVEAEIIKSISTSQSVVIIGRCGSHILRDHPRHTSIFLHADIEFRKNRIQELYDVSHEKACDIITQSDKERARYQHLLTGQEWHDARQYNLSIDTSKISLDNVVEIILHYLGTG